LLMCCLAVGVHVHELRLIGPLDEQAHLDYVNRLLHGELPALGDTLDAETRRQVACRGLETPSGSLARPDCRGPVPKLPEPGNCYEATQPPIYYGITAVLSRVVPGDDVNSIRLIGGLWLGAGAVALFLTLRRLRVGHAFATVISLAIALT